jgi:hypothetical protein
VIRLLAHAQHAIDLFDTYTVRIPVISVEFEKAHEALQTTCSPSQCKISGISV